jgi:hypothetical protein
LLENACDWGYNGWIKGKDFPPEAFRKREIVENPFFLNTEQI